jgi:hypothetical protein
MHVDAGRIADAIDARAQIHARAAFGPALPPVRLLLALDRYERSRGARNRRRARPFSARFIQGPTGVFGT